MDLEKIAAPLRPRSQWEAADLGIAMVRAWWPQALLAWCLIAVPAYVLAFSTLPLGWAALAVWWLRPVFERLPLFVYSRAMFGAMPTLQQTVEALPRLTLHETLSALTVSRLDPVRSFHMPVAQLENLNGEQYRLRCKILDRNSYSGAIGLTLIGPWLEFILLVSILTVVISFWPLSSFEPWSETLLQTGDLQIGMIATVILAVVLCLTTTFCELIYAASGFALYISRRQELEGWDVELAFRRLAARVKRTHADRGAQRVGALLMLIACLTTSLAAQDLNRGPLEPARQVIDQVLADPDFARTHEQSRWMPKDSFDRSPDRDRSALGRLIASIMRAVVIVLTVLGILWLIWILAKNAAARQRPSNAEEAPPEILFGLDIRPESLPGDVPAAALRLLSAGEITACLSLLYRASLADLVARSDFPIVRSSTEHDCMLIVDQNAEPPAAGYFRHLTVAWQACAYGHKNPPTDTTSALCSDFERHFGEPE